MFEHIKILHIEGGSIQENGGDFGPKGDQGWPRQTRTNLISPAQYFYFYLPLSLFVIASSVEIARSLNLFEHSTLNMRSEGI